MESTLFTELTASEQATVSGGVGFAFSSGGSSTGISVAGAGNGTSTTGVITASTDFKLQTSTANGTTAFVITPNSTVTGS